jgi:hypothetical protein
MLPIYDGAVKVVSTLRVVTRLDIGGESGL